jgi:restriction system protein
MARRSDSIFEDIADITSKFPWWVGVSLALVSFFFLQWYAGRALPAVTGTGGLYENVLPGMLHSLAFFGRFVVPAAFLLGSLTSVILNYKRAKLYDKTSRSVARNPLNHMSWRDFEFLAGEYFRRRQFIIEETKTGADGGVDLIAKKGNEKYLVQCKHWQADKVGVKVVRELLGVIVDAGANGGIVVTSGEFTQDASVFARANNIRLLDGRELHNNMKSDVNFEHKPERKTGRKLPKVISAFAGLLVIAVGYSLLPFDKSGSSIYSTWSTQIKEFFPHFQEHHGTNDTQTGKPIKQTERKDLSFTDDQVQKATEEILREKSREQFISIEMTKESEEKKYLYEIEFVSGGRVYSDNVKTTDKEIIYQTAQGLVVSLNKLEVKTMKKTRVAE